MKKKWAIETPAKINLYLEILEKRPDSYHNIRTIFLPITSLTDRLELVTTDLQEPTMSLQPNLNLSVGADNLCLKAARAFTQKTEIKPSWHFTLTKHIPIAAGCGGGSSDAAATLRLLNQIYNEPLTDEELQQIAVKLGADVPFFLHPRLAKAEGIGERLSPLTNAKLSHGALLLINPKFPMPASWAYQHWQQFQLPQTANYEDLYQALCQNDLKGVMVNTFNHFDGCILEKFPIIKIIFDNLATLGLFAVHISGSGPTVFAVDELARITQAYKQLHQRYGDLFWFHLENLEE